MKNKYFLERSIHNLHRKKIKVFSLNVIHTYSTHKAHVQVACSAKYLWSLKENKQRIKHVKLDHHIK